MQTLQRCACFVRCRNPRSQSPSLPNTQIGQGVGLFASVGGFREARLAQALMRGAPCAEFFAEERPKLRFASTIAAESGRRLALLDSAADQERGIPLI